MALRVQVDFDTSKIVAENEQKARAGLLKCVKVLLERANQIVPHDEGTLMRSGQFSVGDRDLIAAVSYDTPYAVRLHEHPEYRFQQNREGKWLEKTINQDSGDLLEKLAAELKI